MNGSKVQQSLITPVNVEVDAMKTKGTAEDEQNLEEKLSQLVDSDRTAIKFAYQIDPLFTVRYRHQQGLYQG